MDKEQINDIADSVSEIFEKAQNTLQLLSIAYLTQNVSKPDKWATLQRSSLARFNNKLKLLGEEFLQKINTANEKALLLTYANAIGDKVKVDKDKKEIELSIDETTEQKLKVIKTQNAVMVAVLVSSISRNHTKAIEKIERKIVTQQYTEPVQQTVKKVELSKTNRLYQEIVSQTEQYGGVENVPKVTYRNGREVSWKSYMEMNVRTTLHTEASDYQIASGTASGVVFYICSSHGDCAKDHAQYQGRLYYDENYTSMGFNEETLAKINSVITTRRLLGVNQVKNNDPWLTTRPNCRHYFEPVPLEDVIDKHLSTKKILNNQNMIKGKYDSDKYIALQQQRYNERRIRYFKSQKDNYEVLLSNATTEMKIKIQKRLDFTKQKIAEWQKRQRELINQNESFLERDYNRETNKVIVQDLGYRIAKRLK